MEDRQQMSPLLDRTHLRETLIMVLDRAMPACAQVVYRLVGTGAALLQGVDLPVGGVDILVKERQEVDAFSAALASFECLFPPRWLPEDRQYYVNYAVNGVEVGISTVEVTSDSDAIETFGRGPWVHFAPIPCGPYVVPAVALELRLATELHRGRPDRYEPIIQYLRAKGCDIHLVRRALDVGRLPQAARQNVLERLTGSGG
jgi:hypothetical protein